jgi:hypothetical protein
MSGLQPVTISLATYKAIEAQRLSFSESHDAIIRRALSERTSKRRPAAGRSMELIRGAGRRRGNCRIIVLGKAEAVMNLKDAYLTILTALVRHKASLFQLLAFEGTERRRWVAPSAEALFMTSPHLAADHAHEIAPNWFVDTNVSRAQIISRLTVACRLAGYNYGQDVTVLEG